MSPRLVTLFAGMTCPMTLRSASGQCFFQFKAPGVVTARQASSVHLPYIGGSVPKNWEPQRAKRLGKDGSPGRIRTSDPAVNSRLLYQLSYRGSGRIYD